jgi:hypothetical protein
MLTASDSLETLYADIDMLRAELRNCLDPEERRQIELELVAAYDALPKRGNKAGDPNRAR